MPTGFLREGDTPSYEQELNKSLMGGIGGQFDTSLYPQNEYSMPLSEVAKLPYSVAYDPAGNIRPGPGFFLNDRGNWTAPKNELYWKDYYPRFLKGLAENSHGDFVGDIGSSISGAVNTVANNPLGAAALPFIGAMTPTGRTNIAKDLISGGAGFMAGGPIGAGAAVGSNIVQQELAKKQQPLTPMTGLMDALKGFAAGKAPALAGIRSGTGAIANQFSQPRVQQTRRVPVGQGQNRQAMLLKLLPALAMMGALKRQKTQLRPLG